uniref:Homeodomain-like protein n=1 Tax=Tanacetum cinerariifolium TaxID=118510 RepID=A0A6L2KCZ5_TANCI|nr:homeodomain-like protein [Tanacetum cinerariifolium]
MENVNPPPTNNHFVLPATLCTRAVQELHELQVISAFVDSHLESIEQFLNNFANQPNEANMNDLESDDESVDTPLVSFFSHSDNDLDNGEVLNELSEYENVGVLRQERIINGFDGDDLAFQYMIGFRKFTAYLDPFLPMNIISRKAYNTIMVEGLEGTGKNLVAIVKDVYMFVESFTYITNFVVFEDIGEFMMSDMTEALMGKPFRKITKLKYDVAKGLISFTKIFDTYIFRMPRKIPRLRNFKWRKIPPLLELSQRDLMNELRHSYEKNKLMYKNCLNLGFEYQVDESMKEWLIQGHMSIHEVTQEHVTSSLATRLINKESG